MKKIFNELIAAIDIGTTKICVIIAQYIGNGQIDVLGIGHAPSYGLKKGVVVDVAKTIQSIKQAVKYAELMADIIIESAVIGISGAHIQSRNAHGAVPIDKGYVQQEDIARVIAAAKAVPLAEGQQLLHALPQFFVIDGNEQRIQDPLNMHGMRLEVQVHMITGSIASVQNIIKCCTATGVHVKDVILEPLASAEAVLSDDERELGVGLLDIGGGTADLALYQQGSIRHTMVVPVAGNHFTSDLAIGLRTTLHDAERIKQEYGVADLYKIDQDKNIEVDLVHGEEKQVVTLNQIVSILAPRAQELFSLVHTNIKTHHVNNLLVLGMVITGGGSLLGGLKSVAQSVLNIPVRLGRPYLLGNEPAVLSHPIYATGYGLLLYAAKKRYNTSYYTQEERGTSHLLMRMKSWVADFF